MESFLEYQQRLQTCASDWIAESGFKAHGKYPFVLHSQTQWRNNLLLPDLASILDDLQRERAKAGLHPILQRMPHSGISTQIMLFNLFLPLIARDDVDAIASVFLRAGTPWPGPGAQIEFEVSGAKLFNEPYKRPTSADMVVRGPSGDPIYVTAKLVEHTYEPCRMLKMGDCEGANPAKDLESCPLHQENIDYWHVLAKHGVDLSKAGALCPLGPSSEFFRTMAMALEAGGHCVLLVHDDNPAFARNQSSRGLWPLMRSILPASKQKKVHLVPLRGITNSLAKSKKHRDWLGRFVHRYGLNKIHLANREPEAVSRLLNRFPPEEAVEIRDIWRQKILGAQGKYDLMAQSGFKRIHTILATHGLGAMHAEWKLIEEYGQHLYVLKDASSAPKK